VIGLISVALSRLPAIWAAAAAGFTYALIGPAHYLYHGIIAPRVIGRAAPVDVRAIDV
jgi:hypothetical protein